MPRRKIEISAETNAILSKLPELEQRRLITKFRRLERRKRDLGFYQQITLEDIDKKMHNLEHYYVKELAKIIAEQYIPKEKNKKIKSLDDLYSIIKNHIVTKTKLQVSDQFIELVIQHLYNKSGYLHIKGKLPHSNNQKPLIK